MKKLFFLEAGAKGNYKRGSDVDLALKGKISNSILIRIKTELNEETIMPYNFDVFDFNEIRNPKLIEHINRVGEKIYPS